MELGIFGNKTQSKAAPIGAAEYLKAKLDYEATPYGLKETLESTPGNIVLVDVREEEAFRREHILGATNIPAADLVKRLADLPRDRTIVTYCWDMTCALAPRAALELAQKGFKVQFLAGGIEEWKKKGYAVKTSA
jgi:rhodanese-related sulfurtransferase